MDLKIVAIMQLIALTLSIEVYEELDEPVYSRFTRNSKYAQQDMQKLRYYQQQQFDLNNRHRIVKRHDALGTLPQAYVHPPKGPLLNFGLNHAANLKLLQENYAVQDLHNDAELFALKNLIGKPPLVQLQGFEQLLNVKDHTPVTENAPDVANPQERPNIKVEPQSTYENLIQNKASTGVIDLGLIEKELNVAAHAHAQKVLEQARQDAEAHVLAQHEAIARAQAQAQAQVAALPTLNLETVKDVTPLPLHTSFGVYGDKSDTSNLQYASKYAFGYGVRDFHSGNNFGHEEKHDGRTARGMYYVLLPDGRLQIVDYWADKTGYHAKVSYDKVAVH